MSPPHTPGIIGALGVAALTLVGAGNAARAHDHETLEGVRLACGQFATVASVPQCSGGPARVAGACARNKSASEPAAVEGRQISCLGPAKRVPGFAGVTLNEFQPWLTTRHEVSAAKGVVYFMRGYRRQRTDDSYHGLHFLLATLSFQGWNIIGAQVPGAASYTQADHPRIGAYIAERARQLRKEGYKRVVVGGQSWGAWDALVAEAQGKLDADALLLIAPASWGERKRPDGRPNPYFIKNRTEFIPLIRAVRKPTALFFFEGDTFDPGGRDAISGEQFKRNKVINLLVSKPPAFKAHVSGVLPVFDALYGHCIERFLAAPAITSCEPGEFSPDDFRSVVSSDQLDETKGVAAATDLAGRSFIVYRLNGNIQEVTLASATTARIRTSREKSESRWQMKEGRVCVGTDCEVMRRWDARRYLGFDAKSKRISSWWIEK